MSKIDWNNIEEVKKYKKEYSKEHKKEWAEYMKRYMKNRRKTPIGRAEHLVNSYKEKDKIHNRGECTLTPKWVVENILFKPCAHCGKTGWNIIGCNRLNNILPHTEENVEPCCKKCNDILAAEDKKKRANFSPS